MVMNKVCLNVLVGIPGAGKTTYCQRIQEYLNLASSSLKVVHICFDDFIKFDATIDLENSTFKCKRKLLLEQLEQLIQCLKDSSITQLEQLNKSLIQEFNCKFPIEMPQSPSKYLILVDDNMYYRSMRYQVFQIARRTITGYFQTFFNASLKSAMSRNRERPDPVPEEVISRMFYKLEKPNDNICKWEKNTINLNSLSIELEIVINRTIQCLEKPVEPLEISQNSNGPVEQSVVHKIDLLLRKAVGEMVKQQRELVSSDEIKHFAEGLLSKRKQLLEDLRAGLAEIDPEVVAGDHIKTLLL